MEDRGRPRFGGTPNGRAPLAVLAFVTSCALVAFGGVVRAQSAPGPSAPVPSPAPSPYPPAAVPGVDGEPAPASAPASAAPASTAPATAASGTSPGPSGPPAEPPSGAPSLEAQPAPTQPPILVEPPSAGVSPGGAQTLRVASALGTIVATVADPEIAGVTIDQAARTFTVTGIRVGSTVVTVADDRGEKRDVPLRVAELAGDVARFVTMRLTGDPATPSFIAERAVAAAIGAAQAKAGASIIATQDSVHVAKPLTIDNVTTVDVPVIIQGPAYFTSQGTTRVRVENVAVPSVRPASLLVSDFPETLKANGTLFTADLSSAKASRFLYYHYNPAGQPDRRIVLLAENSSDQPATVQYISGAGGPFPNEMAVGHDSTQRFLVRLLQNEGAVVVLPPHTTQVVLAQPLPAGMVVSNLLQLHEIAGAPLHLTLLAQNASDPVGGTVPPSVLLDGDVPHARGIYPIPEFFFDYRYDAQGPDLQMPIGQIPLPNLRPGNTLAGDYGVLQSLTIRMVNYDKHNAAQVALYADPRGGRATGTFVIDRELVQVHAIPPFAHFKLRQYTIPPRAYVETDVVTMPEGGSSYPLRLEIAPDDGSIPPGQPGSPVY